jgi:hypothetical protein
MKIKTVDVFVKTWWKDLSICCQALQFLERNWKHKNSNIIVLADRNCESVTKTWGVSERVKFYFLDPWPDGNGFQQYLTLLLDEFSEADLYAIFDSDTMLVGPMDLSMLLEDGKPIHYYQPYLAEITNAQYKWSPIMERWLGVKPQADYMQGFPFLYRPDTIAAVRRLITSRTGSSVHDSLYSAVPYHGPASFVAHPFKFCEHNVMGFYAALHERDRYVFKDLTTHPYRWPVKQYWSWGWNQNMLNELAQMLRCG